MRVFPSSPPSNSSIIVLILAAVLSLSFVLPPTSCAADITAETLRETEKKVQEIARKTLPATVALIPGGPARRFGTGTGVIVSEDGLILTAAHVSMEMNEKVTVIFPDGKRANGKVLGMDYSRDAGMIQITDKGKKFPYVELGDDKTLEANDWTIALGHAGGFQHDRTPPVRLGRVIRNDPKGFLMTDSALIGGDSGGPLFDIDGNLIGIHSNIGFSLMQNNHVPISTFVANWDRLLKNERWGGFDGLVKNPDRPVMGAEVADPPEGEGAMIGRILPKSPAEKAGLEQGDIVIEADDLEIGNTDSLLALIRQRKAGEQINLLVKREDTEKKVTVKLATAKSLERGPRGSGPRGSGPRGRPAPQKEPEPRSPEEKKKLQEDFNKKMRESIEKGEIQFTEEDMKKFRTPSEFMESMEKFRKSLTPEELEKLVELGQASGPPPVKPGVYDPDALIPVSEDFFREVLNAFHSSVEQASEATHLVFRGNDWKSLCTVVHEDGYVITKASEVKEEDNRKLTVMLAKDRLVPAKIVKTWENQDLALLKLEGAPDLTAVTWNTAGEKLPLGSFLSAAGSGPDPIAIGLVSVLSRKYAGANKGFLGIGTAPHEKGVEVTMVLREGNAGKAGVKKGDIIFRIDEMVCDTPEKLIKRISNTQPGETVMLHFLREGGEAALKVKLGDRSKIEAARQDPSPRMNRMGTEISEKRSGFSKVLQTDLPIQPQQCGGPVVDLDGNVVGITIARAGRIKTYTLPSAEIEKLVKPELDRLLENDSATQSKGKPSKPGKPVKKTSSPEPAAP